MKLDMLKRNVGDHVQLEPPAIHLDHTGRELPVLNEDWFIASVSEPEIRLEVANQPGLATVIGADAVYSYTSNPSRYSTDEKKHGFLLLKVQLFIRGGGDYLPPVCESRAASIARTGAHR